MIVVLIYVDMTKGRRYGACAEFGVESWAWTWVGQFSIRGGGKRMAAVVFVGSFHIS